MGSMSDDAHIQAATTALQQGGVVVIRTDTIYGIIALASHESGVEKVYRVKKRDTNKQCIILALPDTLPKNYAGQIQQTAATQTTPTSVIVPASTEPGWLLRGGDTIAYRLVQDPTLQAIIRRVGNVIAPSANPEGLPPARTIAEARDYFGPDVDVYIDGGTVPETVSASQIVRLYEDGSTEIVRS
ncbi:hypothetical protein CL689_03385 [Candidatus Saccharibacteria bacterium]|nr:hypothetical protein [Candidatus Saccharibacteria bacterium]MBJ58695.1 hypothetical protein [Candidatus Saccharibacteria bacterium]MBQ69084.1 hypothetical protein [Candidatus Saccharibacteria bacterium]